MRRGSPDSKAFEAPVPFLGLTGLQLISIVCSGKSQSEFFGTAGWRAVSVFPKAPFLETDTEDLTLCFLTTLLGTGPQWGPGGDARRGCRPGGPGRSRADLELSPGLLQSTLEHSGRANHGSRDSPPQRKAESSSGHLGAHVLMRSCSAVQTPWLRALTARREAKRPAFRGHPRPP